MKKIETKATLRATALLLITFALFAGAASADVPVQDLISSVHNQVASSYSQADSGVQGTGASGHGTAGAGAAGMFGVAVSEAQSISVKDNSLTMAFATAGGNDAHSESGASVESPNNVYAVGGGIATGGDTAASVTTVAGFDESMKTAGVDVSASGAVDAETSTLAVAWS